MYQGIRMSQVIQKFVSQPLALVSAGDQTSNVKKFDWDRSSTFNTAAVVGFASVRKVIPGAGAFYLKVSNRPLGVDSRETKGAGSVSAYFQ